MDKERAHNSNGFFEIPFNVSATDEVIDFVMDAHFAMFADQ